MMGMMPQMDGAAVISKYPHLSKMLLPPPPTPLVDRYDDAMTLQQIAFKLGVGKHLCEWKHVGGVE